MFPNPRDISPVKIITQSMKLALKKCVLFCGCPGFFMTSCQCARRPPFAHNPTMIPPATEEGESLHHSFSSVNFPVDFM